MSQSFALPTFTNTVQWHHNIGYARDVCARLFRDGRSPSEALTAFGLPSDAAIGWSTAVDRITAHLSAPQTSAPRKAA
jgi:hypothetical protein